MADNSIVYLTKDDPAMNKRLKKSNRFGFTLIELLLVISIIGILTALALMVIRGAEHDARVNRSESQTQRINQLLASEWEEYLTRVLPFRITAETSYQNMLAFPATVMGVSGLNDDLTANEIEAIRNRAIIELVRVEFPNSLENLMQYPSETSQMPGAGVNQAEPDYWPALWVNPFILNMADRGNTRLTRLRDKLDMVFVSTKPNTVEIWDRGNANNQNEGAECLYAILQTIRINGTSGLEYARIRDNEVGDTDGDGRLEILDAFGDPLQFTYDNPETDTVESLSDYLDEPRVPVRAPFVVFSVNEGL